MKLLFVTLFVASTSFVFSQTTKFVCKELQSGPQNCEQTDFPQAVGLQKVNGSLSKDGIFSYTVTFCSMPFAKTERHIRFEMTFMDSTGMIFATSKSGPVLKGNANHFGETYSGKIALDRVPFSCGITTYFMDINVPANAPDAWVARNATNKDLTDGAWHQLFSFSLNGVK